MLRGPAAAVRSALASRAPWRPPPLAPRQAAWQCRSFHVLGDDHGHSHEHGHGHAHEGEAKPKNAVVLSKRLPEDFVENTLMPHLESQLLEHVHVYLPAELAQIARVYSKQAVRQRALCIKLAETVVYRMVAFEAVDIVDILGPMWIMIPDYDEVFEALEERILKKIDDFTALNLMGIIRIYNKRSTKHHELLAKVVPRMRELLRAYEGIELCEMLVSMAQSKEAATDMDILMTLVPEIERRYSEVSLLHCINNIWALTQLRMIHKGLLTRVAEDLKNPQRTKDLTTVYMARIAWVYRRCNAWDMVSESILPLIKSMTAEFRCADFARLAQALPEEKQMLGRIADVIGVRMDELGRKDFMLYFLGLVHGELLEPRPDGGDAYGPRTAQCLAYVRDEQDNFKRDEVQKIVYLLHHSPKYHYLCEDLPASWNTIKAETMDYIRAK